MVGTAAEAADARKKFVHKLSFGLLDYRHHALVNLEKCVETLLLICRNVVDEPANEKFRRVRASNKRIVAAFSAHPAAPELLQICGWRTKVEELERYWTFDALPGSLGMGLLEYAVEQLQKAQGELQSKQKAGVHDKKAADAVERDKVLRSIESDRQEREERLERQRAAASATAAVAQTKASLVGSPAAKDKEI